MGSNNFYNPYDPQQPPPPQQRSSPVAKPLIALAISVALAVVIAMSYLFALCGMRGHQQATALTAVLVLLGAALLAAFVSFIWFIVALVRK